MSLDPEIIQPEKKRMGRPPKPKAEKLKKIGAKDGEPIADFTLSIDKAEREILTEIAQAHDCENISFLNRGLARGEIILVKLNSEEFNRLKSIAKGLSFNSLEAYLTAIATDRFPTPLVLKKPSITANCQPSVQIHTWTKRQSPARGVDQSTIRISKVDQLLLRALSLHHGFVVPSGKNSGDGSPTILNRNILQGNVSLLKLPVDIVKSLHLLAKSYDFSNLEEFLLSLVESMSN